MIQRKLVKISNILLIGLSIVFANAWAQNNDYDYYESNSTYVCDSYSNCYSVKPETDNPDYTNEYSNDYQYFENYQYYPDNQD